MKICPICNAQLDENSKFCQNCGAQLTIDEAPAMAEAYAEPETLTVSTPAAKKAPSKAKSITGMALSIAGLSLGALGLLYTFIFLFVSMAEEDAGYVGFVMGLVMSVLSAPPAILGLIFSLKELSAGANNAFSRIGKGIGIAAVIVVGVTLLLAFICLGIANTYRPYYY